LLERNHPRISRARKRWIKPRGAGDPTQLASSWLRLADATITGAGYSSVLDELNANPAVQTTDAQRPVPGVSAGGLPTAVFSSASSKNLQWPVTAKNYPRTRFWWAMWVAQPVSTLECLITTFGANNAIQWYLEASRRLRADIYMPSGNGRFFRGEINDLPPPGTPFFAYLFYDSAVGGDGCLKMKINGVESVLTAGDLGSGETLGVLAVMTHMKIGCAGNAGSHFLGLNGTMGPNIFTGLGPDLTLVEHANLMNFEMLT
jgi:hypothetical protein